MKWFIVPIAAVLMLPNVAYADAPLVRAAASITANSESIPPNCTLDPWTGKLTCHIWPTCTIDPWTGKMTCPVPRPALTRL